MSALLVIIGLAIVVVVGLAAGYLLRGAVDVRGQQRLERVRVQLGQLQAERQIHELASNAFAEMEAVRSQRQP